ncbi:hypothetical protein ACFFJY_17375 [Fictibacillus aquaticus]|uniref:DUF4352 domain-containing protein n=1 Tax=Fictibacillus aquaticus TaxID=2021314 RepID=A0A235F620_9BACL|nr:hypothetical protein [Fictibacillus aquaticus]OYD56682.1 hypothetical protein CGZ90_16880 [Fictibacillus aquaticus]
MGKKKIIALAAVLLAVIAWGTRVYYVNAEVARKYNVETFRIGDIVPIDEAEFKVKNISYGKAEKTNGFTFVPFSVEMEVKNTSDKNVSAINLIETKLAFGYNYYQTRDGEFEPVTLRNLPPGATETILLTYQVDAKFKDTKGKLYLDQHLYKEHVSKEYKKGKRYGIAIEF